MKHSTFIILLFISFHFYAQPSCVVSSSTNQICPGQNTQLSVQNPTSSCLSLSQYPSNLLISQNNFYPFCNNSNDNGAIGCFNNLTPFNALPTSDRFNNSPMAFDFNGVSAYMFAADNCLPQGNSARTICFWMYDRKSLSLASDSIASNLLCYGTNTTNSFFQILHLAPSLSGQMRFNFAGNIINSTIGANFNSWQHVAFVMNAASNYSIYINGVNAGTGTLSINTLSSGNFRIGQSTILPNYYFNGKIDDIYTYTRALSQSEILQLYNINLGTPIYSWSTGATTSSITVTPSVTTTYTVSVNNGFNTCNSSITVTVSTCIGINELHQDFDDVHIYPNPVKDLLNIKSNNESYLSIEILNSFGSSLAFTKFQNSIDISFLKQGLYYLKLRKSDNTSSYFKFIID